MNGCINVERPGEILYCVLVVLYCVLVVQLMYLSWTDEICVILYGSDKQLHLTNTRRVHDKFNRGEVADNVGARFMNVE